MLYVLRAESEDLKPEFYKLLNNLVDGECLKVKF